MREVNFSELYFPNYIFSNSILSVPSFTHLLSFASLFKNPLDNTIGKNFTYYMGVKKTEVDLVFGFFGAFSFSEVRQKLADPGQ